MLITSQYIKLSIYQELSSILFASSLWLWHDADAAGKDRATQECDPSVPAVRGGESQTKAQALRGLSLSFCPHILGHVIERNEIQAYVDFHGIKDSQATDELVAGLVIVAEQSDQPYQLELPIAQGNRVLPPLPREVRDEAILTPGQIVAADFGPGDRISALLPQLITRKIPSFCIDGAVIECPRDFAALLLPLRSPLFETLKVAFLDDDGKVLHSQVLTAGTLNATLLETRDILASLRDAKSRGNTHRVIVAHNHPGGDPTPSNDDHKATALLKKAFAHIGLDMVDHVVTNGKKFYSFASESFVEFEKPPLAPWEKVSTHDLVGMHDLDIFAQTINGLRQGNPDYGHILFLNTRLKIVAVERFPERTAEPEALFSKILDGSVELGSMAVMVDIPFAVEPHGVCRLRDKLREMGVDILDAGDRKRPSYRSAKLFSQEGPGAKPNVINQFMDIHAPGIDSHSAQPSKDLEPGD